MANGQPAGKAWGLAILMFVFAVAGCGAIVFNPPDHDFFWFRVLPTIFFPLSTILLGLAIRQGDKNRRRGRSSKWPAYTAFLASALAIVGWVMYGGLIG